MYSDEEQDHDDLEVIIEHEATENDQNVNETEENNDNEEETQADKKEAKPKRVIKNPQPKLNAETLKGPKGIHTLPSVFENVKFKGIGHEEEDLNTLMKTYEYWCHRLFPKLSFDDCLAKIESLGQKKPVQTHIKKIRMGLVLDEISNTVDSDHEDALDENDDLREPLNDNDNTQRDISDEQTLELTREQLERIEQNRKRALEILEKRRQNVSSNVSSASAITNLDPEIGNGEGTNTAEVLRNKDDLPNRGNSNILQNNQSELENVQIELSESPAELSNKVRNNPLQSSDSESETGDCTTPRNLKSKRRVIESSEDESDQEDVMLSSADAHNKEHDTEINLENNDEQKKSEHEDRRCTLQNEDDCMGESNLEMVVENSEPSKLSTGTGNEDQIEDNDLEEMDIDSLLETIEKTNN